MTSTSVPVFTFEFQSNPPGKSLRDVLKDGTEGLPAKLMKLIGRAKLGAQVMGSLAIVASPEIVSLLEVAAEHDEFRCVPQTEVAPCIYHVAVWRGHLVYSSTIAHRQWGHVALKPDSEPLGRFQVYNV